MNVKFSCHFAEVENDKESMDILKFKPERLGHSCKINDEIEENQIE